VHKEGKPAVANNLNAVAGTSAGGVDGLGLVWMAQTGSTAPTDSTTALAAAWKNMGGIAESGVSIKQSVSTSKKKFYGSTATQRTLVTDQDTSIDVTFAEVNARVMEVYWKRALNSITPTVGTGAFQVVGGSYTRQLYALVIDMIDGSNRLRFYCPQVEVTSNSDLTISNSEMVQWGVSLSCYPDTSGNYIYQFGLIPSLG
jgi:hypothetical protein